MRDWNEVVPEVINAPNVDSFKRALGNLSVNVMLIKGFVKLAIQIQV